MPPTAILMILPVIVGLTACKPKQLKSSDPLIPPPKTALSGDCQSLASGATVERLQPDLTDGSRLRVSSLSASPQSYAGQATGLNLTPGSGGDYVLWNVCTIEAGEDGQRQCFPEAGSDWHKSYYSEETLIFPFTGKVILTAMACTEHPSDPSVPCGPPSVYRFIVENKEKGNTLAQGVRQEIDIQLELNSQLQLQADGLLKLTKSYVDLVGPYMNKDAVKNESELLNLYNSARNILSMSGSKLFVFLKEEFLPGIRAMQQNEQQQNTGLAEGTAPVGGCQASGFGDATRSIDPSVLKGQSESLRNQQIPDELSGMFGDKESGSETQTKDLGAAGQGEPSETTQAQEKNEGTEATEAAEKSIAEIREENQQSREENEKEEEGQNERNRDRTRYMVMGFGALTFMAAGAKLWFANEGFFKALKYKHDLKKTLVEIRNLDINAPDAADSFSKKIDKLKNIDTELAILKSNGSLRNFSDLGTGRAYFSEALKAEKASNIATGDGYRFIQDTADQMLEGGGKKTLELQLKNGQKIGGERLDINKVEIETKGFSWGKPLMIAILASVLVTVGSFELTEKDGDLGKVRGHTREYLDAIGAFGDNIIYLLEQFEDSEKRLRDLTRS